MTPAFQPAFQPRAETAALAAPLARRSASARRGWRSYSPPASFWRGRTRPPARLRIRTATTRSRDASPQLRSDAAHGRTREATQSYAAALPRRRPARPRVDPPRPPARATSRGPGPPHRRGPRRALCPRTCHVESVAGTSSIRSARPGKTTRASATNSRTLLPLATARGRRPVRASCRSAYEHHHLTGSLTDQ